MPDRSTDPLLIDVEGHVECLLGNVAIVRGALEAGVAFAAGYPGTPSSEVTDSFARVAERAGVVFEYSVNEKIALEMAFAASLAGARSICAMKHLGLMYAGDPLSTIPYVGVVAGMVIVSAGDPSCRTSPNEQDQRYLAPMLHIPMLDPSTPAEAHAMTRFAFELSEKSRLPVILRPTTRVCHTRANVRYGRLLRPVVTGFERDPRRFVPIPINARRLRLELSERIETARRLMSEADLVRSSGKSRQAIVASGAPAATCADLLRERGLEDQLALVTVGGVYPLPEPPLLEALQGVERVLVVEELSPFLEDCVRSLCGRHGLNIEVLGKRTGHLPVEFEYDPALIQRAIHEGLGVGPPPLVVTEFEEVPPRPPTMCPGCPHRASQFAVRTAFGPETLYFNDIGCYTLGYGPPLNTADAVLCMGAGFSLAAGVSRVTGRRTVGLLGDSTFFHSGMPALLDAIKEDVNMVAVILDNQVTAMTGFQESPGVSFAGDELSRSVSIEGLVSALGARHVETVDPYDLPAAIAAFERARDATGVSVVICKRACPGFVARETHKPYKTGTFAVDHDLCRTCGREQAGFRCKDVTSEGFERHMARCRAMEVGTETEPRPGQAPCSARCPLGLCIQGFVGNIAAGRYREAYQQIVEHLPLPDSVCRVCHRPCEAACVRGGIDEPVAISDLKRFVVDRASTERFPYEPERDPDSGKRVAVVGAGPSGLAAAHDLCLRGLAVTLFDENEKPGGLLRSGIPGYRLPEDALDRDVARILDLGVTFEGGRELGKDIFVSDLLEQGFDAVYLATGALRAFPLGIPGEGEQGRPPVVDALAYLEAVNHGRPVDTGERVVVVGGGNAAVDAARAARRLGAGQVTIAYRRRRDEMPAIAGEVEAAQREGVEILVQVQPVRMRADGISVLRTEPGEPDESGRSRPVPVKGSERTLPADLVVAAIGQAPDPALFEGAGLGLGCDRDGSLRVEPGTCRTAHPRIFAGGDLAGGGRTVTEAIAAGKRAAWEMDRLLRGAEAADRRPPPPAPDPDEPAGRPGVERVDRAPRRRPVELSFPERLEDFAEVVQGLTEAQARAEAARCMVCGLCGNCRTCLDLFGCPAFYVADDRIHIDPELCMGCGVCAELCPNGAIREVSRPPPDRDHEPAFGPIDPSAGDDEELENDAG